MLCNVVLFLINSTADLAGSPVYLCFRCLIANFSLLLNAMCIQNDFRDKRASKATKA